MLTIDVDYLGLLDDMNGIMDQELSRDAMNRFFREWAKETIDEVKPPKYTRDSSGRLRDARGRFAKLKINEHEGMIANAEIDDTITVEFADPTELIRFIGHNLETFSPVLTGKYRRSHKLFADGREIDFDGDIPPANQYVFVNAVPYARKIEKGRSSEAPDGVYQVVAVLAQREFSSVAQITYAFASIRGERNPAIIVRM